ncbi:hypothetical protein ABT024_06935 [Streptomyces sp. NPDC002812]|uniref:hypothetical protein n=1 Tax=Streptomyces sp. NPDC002812 TaxID=3154434 RepID=UPI003323A00D
MTQPPAPDWWTDLYPETAGDDERALRRRLFNRLHRPTPPTTPPGTVTVTVPTQPDTEPRWHQGHPAADQPPQPGVHVTIVPEAAAQPPAWRARIRRWIAFHGLAAAAGWALGLTGAIANYLASAGDGGAAAGAGLILITGIFSYWLPHLQIVPAPLRPAVLWVCRIPPASTLLALALYTPHALIGGTP